MRNGLKMRRFTPSPNWQRLVQALTCSGEPDRPPLIELIVNLPVQEAFLGRPIRSFADQVAFWYEAGYDYVSLCPGYWVIAPGFQPREGWRRAVRKTHYGEIEVTWGTEGVGIITSMDDFRSYRFPTLEDVDFSFFNYCMDPKNLPEGMKVVARAGDIFTWVWQLMGFENFCLALAEDLELVEALFDRLGNFIYSIFLREAELDEHGMICAFWYSDDIAYVSGPFVSPEIYRRYLFPWMRKIGDVARQKGVPYIYHSDGDLRPVLDDLADCGITALHPIEPKAMDAAELKRKEGHRFCLCGNIEVDTLARGTPEQVRQLTLQRLELLAPGGGYCPGSSNTVPDYVPLENYVAMLNAVFEYAGA